MRDVRDNNFNLLRMLAAFAVLVSHSFALTQGMDAQPAVHGIRLGAFAVDVFFVTSGYLITASLMRRSLVEFVVARLLRIYPALIVCVTLTALAILVHTGDFEWNYWLRNALLLPGAPNEIEGVFSANHSHGINGSLWTLPYEVRMYAAVALLWVLTKRWFRYSTPLVAALALAYTLYAGSTLAHLAWMFFAGATLQVFKVEPRLSTSLEIACLLALAALHPRAFGIAYLPALPYLTLAVALLPKWFGGYNRIGDYSYGVYIYAFPVQQSVIALGITSVGGVFATASLITLALAFLSWHLVEKRALQLKDLHTFATYRTLP